MRLGSKGVNVRNLQHDLIKLGFGEFLGKWGSDGHFGSNTKLAVEQFQKHFSLKVDGIVGSQTRNKIVNEKKNAGIRGTRNFSISEFVCKGSRTMLQGGMDSNLLLQLEELRYVLGGNSIIINSGYRSPNHNRSVGGAKNSQHIYGKAADIRVNGKTPNQVYNEANKIFKNGGVGRYNTFTHVDVRGTRVRF